jgi:hypothetical protein
MPPIRRPLLGNGEAYRQQVIRPRGGGPPRPRRTIAEAQERLQPQLDAAIAAAAALPPEQRGDRVVIEATLLPAYIANSHYPRQAVGVAGLEFVGTRTTPSHEDGAPTKTLLLAGTDASLPTLRSILLEPTHGAHGAQRELVRLDVIRLPPTADALRLNLAHAPRSADGRVAADALLHPAVDRAGRRSAGARALALDRFTSWVVASGGEILPEQIRVVGDLTFVPLLAPDDACARIASFNGLRVLRDLAPAAPLPLAATARALMPGADPDPPADSTAAGPDPIYVFDGPVESTHPYLRDFVRVRDLAQPMPGPRNDAFDSHGTWVSSAALHGPIVPVAQLPRPAASVEHLVIAPRDGEVAHMPWALQQIAAIVRAERPAIVNISVAPAHHVEDDDEPHDWTIALDRLAHELDVLFVVAVGNAVRTPAARIQVPADMVNGLAVGACDQRSPTSPWARARYSLLGPGRAGARIRPTGIMFGGTETSSFFVAHPGDQIERGVGTSLSAPTVARGLAALRMRLGDRSSATTLRAFAAHFAEPHPDGLRDEVGHGRIPEDFAAHLACSPDEITVLYQDVLARDEVVSLPVPVPAEPQRGYHRLRWTLAYSSPISGEDAFEYTLAGVDLAFRPNVLATSMAKAGERKSIAVHLQRDAARIHELQQDGWSVTGVPQTRPLRPDRPEHARRREGKWESLVRGHDRLRGSSLNRPTLWLDYLARAGGDIWRGDDVPPLPFSLLVTVTGPPGSNLYDNARAELDLLVDVPVTLDIDIEI